ncbi:hypothetical protein OSH08_11110 [Kaistia geumhonensis]|uniref:Uncharacterized protein n=1 Tax=Kaistia geumhonensis TaxID=410839 RepID=A0ABU0M2R0_9HYPH|nr:hypothetical protein [Kaistia geumhonensis]MCX5479555.1 hypothetical protein [Kaistia geumhonensis]MDQ0515222.1 hypothetical protein [Kaistia geumhonensis]
MKRSLANAVLPMVTLMAFEVAALSLAAQAWFYFTAGTTVIVTLGGVLEASGIPAPPAEWMDGSVYDMVWNEPLALIAIVIGLLGATYAGIARYERAEREGNYVYP